jgi:hypothetical protein
VVILQAAIVEVTRTHGDCGLIPPSSVTMYQEALFSVSS